MHEKIIAKIHCCDQESRVRSEEERIKKDIFLRSDIINYKT